MPGEQQQVDDDRADLGEHHLGGELVGPLDPAGRLADREQRRPRGDGHPVGRQLVGHRVGGVGQVERRAARRTCGHRPAVVGRDRGLPHQHPGAAQRPVERVDQLDHPPQVARLCRTRNGEDATTARPSSAASCSSRIRWSVDRASASSVQRPLDLAVDHHLAGGPQQRRRSCAPRRAACSRGRRSGAAGTTVAATSATAPPTSASVQRVSAAPGSGSSVLDHDRLHRRLGDEELAAVEQERRRHRQRDDQRRAATSPMPSQPHEQVAEEDPDARPRPSPRRPGAAAGRRTCRG